MPIALTRDVPAAITRCELTHVPRQPIDLARAREQHAQYGAALKRAGCEVRSLPPAPDLPDSVFVEDAAVVFDEIAIITRPGAASRRPETASVAAALADFRALAAIDAPGILDGGDVLVIGRSVFVGVGSRSDAEGVRQLQAHLAPLGYTVSAAEVRGCLHLKSAATLAAPGVVLLNPGWVDPASFAAWERVEIDAREPFGANVLLAGDTLLVAATAPRTADRLRRRGLEPTPIDLSELAKAEGALTCCSLIFSV